jgi:hypothetical protein
MQEPALTLADLIQLHSELNAQVISLWTWFVAGNFAALAAYFSVQNLVPHIKGLFLAGFWFYAVGNLILVRDNLRILAALTPDIESILDKAPDAAYAESISVLSQIDHPVWVAIVFHLAVDVVITLIVIYRKGKCFQVTSPK